MKACQRPGCGASAKYRVGWAPYCSVHQTEKLQEVILSGIVPCSVKTPTGLTYGEGRKKKRWLRCLGLLVEKVTDCEENGLSKAKIEHRSRDFKIEGKMVEFSMVRHPVGRVQEQRWNFNIETSDLSLVSEWDLESKYPGDTANGYRCPECDKGLNVSPGRAKCFECGYEDRKS